MLPTHTILKRRTAKGDPLDELRVVGLSPVKDPTVADWVGSAGEAYIVQPNKDFGASEVIPYDVIAREYEVFAPEEPETVIEVQKPQLLKAPTPEQAFAQAAAESERAAKKAKPATKA